MNTKKRILACALTVAMLGAMGAAEPVENAGTAQSTPVATIALAANDGAVGSVAPDANVEATAAPDASADVEATATPDANANAEATATPEASADANGALEASPAPDAANGLNLVANETDPGLNGTTEPVNDATTLADGEYAPADFAWSGGSGRTSIDCDAVIVREGRAIARIRFSSENYRYVKASGGKFDARVENGASIFEIPIELNADNRIIGMTTAMSEAGREIEYSIRVTLTEPEASPSAPETPADGDYDLPIESGFKMFKITSRRAQVVEGKIIATIGTSSGTYDRIYLGSKADIDPEQGAPSFIQGVANADGGYDFSFELAQEMLGKQIDFVPGKPDGSWYVKNQYQLSIPASLVPLPKPEASVAPEEPTKVEDGEYNTAVDSSSSMFKVTGCKLTVKDGKISAVITLSGTGYDYLFIGTAEQAASADAGSYIPFVADESGAYSYALSEVTLDTPIAIAAHSIKKDIWYDRELTFRSDAMQRVDAPTQNPSATPSADATPSPEASPTPAPEATATPAPTDAPSLDGSTSRVDSSTSLADGSYAPDKFSVSGGTGRVRISCTKITVSGGKATATVVFDSANYGYVKANGRKYDARHSGGQSIFEFPIKLNANNRVIGMTTAMSTPHEIEYTMYFYIEAAEGSNAEEAARFAGMELRSTDENQAAELFSVHRLAGDMILIEIEGAGNYLIAPRDAELPAGVEAEATVVYRPVQRAYVAFEEMYEMIALCGEAAQNCVAAAGFESESGAPANIGGVGEIDYASMLKLGCDLAVVHEQFADGRVLAGAKDARREELADADAAALAEVAERMAMLEIPLFVDRSFDEASERGRLEWIKLYGLLFGCEAEANAAYAAAVAELPEEA